MYYGTPERRESIKVSVALDKEKYEQVRQHAETIMSLTGGSSPIELREGDTLNLSYKFAIDYYGKVTEAFAAMLAIMNTPGVVKDISLEELNHGECLIQTILGQIEKFKQHAA